MSLKPVNADCLFFTTDVVVRKMARTIARHLKLQGSEQITKEQYETLVPAVELHKRFMMGDYRASDEELQKLADAGQCLLDLHQECERLPKKIHTVDISKFRPATEADHLVPGAYGEVNHQVAAGVLEGFSKDRHPDAIDDETPGKWSR